MRAPASVSKVNYTGIRLFDRLPSIINLATANSSNSWSCFWKTASGTKIPIRLIELR